LIGKGKNVYVVLLVIAIATVPFVNIAKASGLDFSATVLSGKHVLEEDEHVYETWEGEHIEIEVCARWMNEPDRPICLWVDHSTLPEGAEVTPDPATGVGVACCVLSWTPAIGQAGTYNITFYAGEECYVPISRFNITIIVHPAVTPGLSFSQLDFSVEDGVVTDTSWGRLQIDVDEFIEYTGIEEGYLNGYSDAGWVIQNILIVPVEGIDTITTFFDLGVSTGTEVTTVSLHIEFTEEPVIEFHDGPRTVYPVGTMTYNIGGRNEPITDVIPSTPITITFDPSGETWHFIKPIEPNENVECADNQCGPMAIANSLQYLENRYGINVPHQHVPGLKGDNTLVGQLDTAMNRGVIARWCGSPVSDPQFMEGKFKYLKDNGLADKLVHKHQGGIGINGDFTRHGITSKDESVNGKVTFDWICKEIKKCEDVEIGISWSDHSHPAGGHWVRVIGCGKVLGVPRLWIADDGIQTYLDKNGIQRGDNKGLEVVEATITDNDNDGWPDIVYTSSANKTLKGEIDFVVSESPKLPMWRYHFSYPGCPGGELRVYATHDCARIKLLFDGYVRSCETWEGYIPEKVNDLVVNDITFDFYWDAPCRNVEHTKLVYPVYNENTEKWELLPMRYVFNHYIPDDLVIPFIGDPTGEIQEIYVVINLREFLENPRPPQESYVITNGRCDELPGYMISTEPIEFNPDAPPEEEPFSWEETLNCILWYDSELTGEPESSCCPAVEIPKGIHIGKITAKVKNNCSCDFAALSWTIYIEGGFILTGKETHGEIGLLGIGEETTIESNFVLGFGSVDVAVTLDDCDTVGARAFVLGPFIFVQ